jgi:hypothetical protein
VRQSKKHAQARILDYLEQGLALSTACALAGVGRRTVYAWMERDKRFAQRVAAARAQPIARAELMLQRIIESGDARAVMWYLERACPAYRLPKETAPTSENYSVELEVVQAPEISLDDLLRGE